MLILNACQRWRDELLRSHLGSLLTIVDLFDYIVCSKMFRSESRHLSMMLQLFPILSPCEGLREEKQEGDEEGKETSGEITKTKFQPLVLHSQTPDPLYLAFCRLLSSIQLNRNRECTNCASSFLMALQCDPHSLSLS